MRFTVFVILLTSAYMATMFGTYEATVIRDIDRRFIFHSMDCQKCISCACKLTDCPDFNPLDFSGAWFQCASKVHDADCSAPFHQHGQWSNWGQWSNCYSSNGCTGNSRSRTRTCTNPAPKNCGETCVGPDTDVDTTCIPNLCQVAAGLGLVPSSGNNPTTGSPKSSTASTTLIPTTIQPTAASITLRPTGLQPTAAPSTRSPVNVQSTAAPQTTRSSQSTPSVTMLPSVTTSCSKFCAVTAVADKRSRLANKALQCQDPSFGSSEALLANCCGLNNTSSWQPGPHIIRQNCTEAPTIVHVNMTQGDYPSPYNYFVIS